MIYSVALKNVRQGQCRCGHIFEKLNYYRTITWQILLQRNSKKVENSNVFNEKNKKDNSPNLNL